MRMYYTVFDRDYVTRQSQPSMTVMSSERKDEFSGLYDPEGRKLYSTDRNPVGFIEFKGER